VEIKMSCLGSKIFPMFLASVFDFCVSGYISFETASAAGADMTEAANR